MSRRLLLLFVASFLLPFACSDDGPIGIAITELRIVTLQDSLDGASLTKAYGDTIQAGGGEQPWLWSIASGSLPAGLTLAAADSGRGIGILGTPTTVETATFTLGVASSDGQTATREYTIAVIIATLKVATSEDLDTISMVDPIKSGVLAVAYSLTLKTVGGDGTNTWTIDTGSLPAGLTLTGAVISGIPTAVGTEYFTLKVASGTQTATQVVSLDVNNVLKIGTLSLPDAVGGVDYDDAVSATGGDFESQFDHDLRQPVWKLVDQLKVSYIGWPDRNGAGA